MVKLFSASSRFGNIRREGETTIYWMAIRENPVAPYTSLISNYGNGFDKRSQEIAVNQYFTLDEINELGEYLASTHKWNLNYKETKIPRNFALPIPIHPPENGILLFEEPEYNLSLNVVGLSSFRMLPGASMGELHVEAAQLSTTWSLFFFEELFKKLGIDLSDKGIFSNENLLKIYDKVFYESGFYIHKFGEKDLLAELTPEKHVARIEKNENLKLQIKQWQQRQPDFEEDDLDFVDDDF